MKLAHTPTPASFIPLWPRSPAVVYRSAAGAFLGCWRTTIPNSSTNGTRSTFCPKSVAPPARGPVTANVVHSGTGGAAGLLARITSARACKTRSCA